MTGFVRGALVRPGLPRRFPPPDRAAPARRRGQLAVAARHQARRARRARHLSGHRVLGPEPRRSRQPPPGRFRRPASGAAPRSTRPSPKRCSHDWRSGRAKLRLLKAGLAFRREHPELFAEGDYVPLEVDRRRRRTISSPSPAGAARNGSSSSRPGCRSPLLDGATSRWFRADRWARYADRAARTRRAASPSATSSSAARSPAAPALDARDRRSPRFPVALLHAR